MRYINKQKESARIRQKESSRVIGSVKNVSFEEIESLIAENLDTRHYTVTSTGGIEAKGRGGRLYISSRGSIVLENKDNTIQMNIFSDKLSGVRVDTHSITLYLASGGITIVF